MSPWISDEFTTSDARRREPSSKSSVAGWLSELNDAGLTELVQMGRGRTPATWRLEDASHLPDASSLPQIEDVFPDLVVTHGHKAQVVGA